LPGELTDMYETAFHQRIRDLPWYRALAACRLCAITALNFRLHRCDGALIRRGNCWLKPLPMVGHAHQLLA
jgi:hypothetical protein